MKKKIFAVAISCVFIVGIYGEHSYANSRLDKTFANLDTFVSTLEKTYKVESNNQISDIAKNSSIVRYAIDELGKPYVYGGNGPEFFDCSGLTKYVFSKAGINIPRVSYEQGSGGKEIRKEDMLPGDLVFFDTRNSNDFSDIKVDVEDILPLFGSEAPSSNVSTVFVPQKVTHVGIYISDGKFIHASSGNEMQVVISDLNNKYYAQRYLFSKRYV